LKTFSKIILLTFLFNSTVSCTEMDKKSDKKLSKKQIMLINGYSQMSSILKGMRLTDTLLFFKVESETIDDFATMLSKSGDNLIKEMNEFPKKTSWINLEQTGASEIQKRTLDAMQADRIKSYAPLAGLKNEIFERTLLLVTSGMLNQARSLAKTMQEIEDDPQRKAFLKRAFNAFDSLYNADVKILNEVYFKHDKFKGQLSKY